MKWCYNLKHKGNEKEYASKRPNHQSNVAKLAARPAKSVCRYLAQ